MTRLALIEVVCFSKILIQRVQKFCTTRKILADSVMQNVHKCNPPFYIIIICYRSDEKAIKRREVNLEEQF